MDGLPNGEVNNAETPIYWIASELFKVDWNPLVENPRFKPMEGHLEMYNEHEKDPDQAWKRLYFRTKDGRFQWYASHCADEHPMGDILLTGATVKASKEEWSIRVEGGKENAALTVRVPSNVFEKWRQALFSHSSSQLVDAYIQPTYPPVPHRKNRVILLELGRHTVSAGVLTQKPSLPLSFFSALCAVGEREGGQHQEVVCGTGAFAEHEANNWTMQGPIVETGDTVTLNWNVLIAILEKATKADAAAQAKAMDIRFRPQDFSVLVAIAQSVPQHIVSSILKTLLDRGQFGFKAVSIVRQPSLVLYSYDVTTGVVVDLGEQLTIVPVIDEFVVEDALFSAPFGAPQIREQLRKRVQGLESAIAALGQSTMAEELLLRYVAEKACFVAADSTEEEHAKGGKEVVLQIGQQASVRVDAETRCAAAEGLFKPKLWAQEMGGLHQLVHEAIQKCPIDSRRTLYRNVYLTGGTSLLRGLAERLEHELSQLVPGSILVQVLASPWRRHAAYLGAHVIARDDDFEKCCVGEANLAEYLRQAEQET